MERKVRTCVQEAEVNIGKLFERIKDMEAEIDRLRSENKRLMFIEREHIGLKRRKKSKNKKSFVL